MNRISGITLIELLISVAILGIVTSIAVPYYQDSIQSSRRMEAINELLKLQLLQESYRLENPSYAETGDLTMPSSDYYTYSISSATASSYTLSAVAKNSQTSDSSCTPLTLDQSMNKSPDSCWE